MASGTATSNGHRPGRATKAQLQEANTALARQVVERDLTLDLFEERLAELELALDAQDWIELADRTAKEFTREGLRKIAYLCRINYVKNPLIKRAVEVMRYYVWAQGVSVSARHPGINDVVQKFWDDPKNRTELTSHQARGLKEVDLGVEGNIFFTLFTSEITGRVRVRTIPFDEVTEVIKNPQDRKEPWYYRREYYAVTYDERGQRREEQVKVLHPDLNYRPAVEPATFADLTVKWDARVLHVKVGGTGDMTFGVPEVYAAVDWAKAVKKDLEDFATLRRALARFAWSLTVKGGTEKITKAKTRLSTTLATGTDGETNPPPIAGSAWIQNDAANLQPMRTAGAAPHPDDARRLGLMVAAAVSLPETILFGDAEVGNLATAKTLDRPTELRVVDRQALWADTLRTLFDHAVRAMARATSPAVDLGGVTLVPEDDADEGMAPHDTVVITDTDDEGNPYTADIVVDFPPVLEHDPEQAIRAVVSGATLDGKTPAGTMTRKEIARQVMTILHVENIDAELDKLWPEGSDESQPPAGYEPPAPASPFGAFTPGDGAERVDEEPFAASLRAFRTQVGPILERWAKEQNAPGLAERIEARMREVAESIAAGARAKVEEDHEVRITEKARGELLARISGSLAALTEATKALAETPTEDARIPALEKALEEARTASATRLEEIGHRLDQLQPIVNVHPTVEPAPVVVMPASPKVEVAAPIVHANVPAAPPAQVVVAFPRKTRTRVTETDKEGAAVESTTEVVEE